MHRISGRYLHSAASRGVTRRRLLGDAGRRAGRRWERIEAATW